jgi:lactam utilization protein B
LGLVESISPGQDSYSVSRTITINCDMGESFGLCKMGDAAAIMPYVTLANVACGFHASDPLVMRRAVRLAKERGVRVDAHPALPDHQGFGRRAMRGAVAVAREVPRAIEAYLS